VVGIGADRRLQMRPREIEICQQTGVECPELEVGPTVPRDPSQDTLLDHSRLVIAGAFSQQDTEIEERSIIPGVDLGRPSVGGLRFARPAALFEVGRLDEAARHAEFALAHDASAAHELLAQIAFKRGDLVAAENEARRALSLESRRPGPRLVLADVLLASGRASENVEVLESAISAGIRDEGLRRILAIIYMSGGGIDQAEAALSGLEESSDPETLVLFGRLAGLRQQWDEARRWLEKALEIHPSNAEAKVNLGVLAAVEGRSSEARRLLEAGVAEDPRSFEGWNALGMVRAGGGDFDGAVAAWNQALELNPEATDLLFNIGLAHAEAGRYGSAADSMESYAETAEGETRERALGLAEQYRQRVRGFSLGIR
jgi:tetratricopeptide (TPR) repeat protein